MYSLNLLPPKVQQESAKTDMIRYWVRAATLVFVSALISSGILAAAWIMLSRHAQSLQSQLSATQADQRKNSATDITTTTTKLITTMKTIGATLGTPNIWSANELIVLQLVPKGALITEFTLEATGSFHITGIADTRQTFITFDTAIKGSPLLTGVTTTLSASRRTDVPFNYSGTLVTKK